MDGEAIPLPVEGPASYANWKAFNRNEEGRVIAEYPLYTDAHVVDEVRSGYGPYEWLNTVPGPGTAGTLQAAIVLRARLYPVQVTPVEITTNTSNYHGGWLPDEIAALTSLCLGIRVKAGDESRMFDGRDPLGIPSGYRFKPTPVLPVNSEKKLQIPRAVGGFHDLKQVAPIAMLPTLSEEKAIAVVRAARLYQDALWISESEPALSWIMFVSALEAAANVWDMADFTPTQKLKEARSSLYKILMKAGGDELVERVAKDLAGTFKATNKFIRFVLAHLPEPPATRPIAWGQVDWSAEAMKTLLETIYDYRSKALHGGIPFPAPMCMPGHEMEGGVAEKPLGLACSTLNAIWAAKDTPMLLHVFEHITRGSLVNWMRELNQSVNRQT